MKCIGEEVTEAALAFLPAAARICRLAELLGN